MKRLISTDVNWTHVTEYEQYKKTAAVHGSQISAT